MLCLHRKPAVTSTNEKGTFWSCAESPPCFKCSEKDAALYEKGINAFLATNQERPKCCPVTNDSGGEQYYAIFRMVDWSMDRPFFTCGNNKLRYGCGYFEWGDELILPPPEVQEIKDCFGDTVVPPHLLPKKSWIEEKIKKRG